MVAWDGRRQRPAEIDSHLPHAALITLGLYVIGRQGHCQSAAKGLERYSGLALVFRDAVVSSGRIGDAGGAHAGTRVQRTWDIQGIQPATFARTKTEKFPAAGYLMEYRLATGTAGSGKAETVCINL